MRWFVTLLCLGVSAHAATMPAASANLADVQAAVNSANGGDTVQVPAGSATWSAGLTISKAIILQGTSTAAPTSPGQGPGTSSTPLLGYQGRRFTHGSFP